MLLLSLHKMLQNQNDDCMPCVTVFTGIIINLFFSQDRIINRPQEFRHAVDESDTGSK